MKCICDFETDDIDAMTWHIGLCPMKPTSKWESHLTFLETNTKVGKLSEQLEEKK